MDNSGRNNILQSRISPKRPVKTHPMEAIIEPCYVTTLPLNLRTPIPDIISINKGRTFPEIPPRNSIIIVPDVPPRNQIPEITPRKSSKVITETPRRKGENVGEEILHPNRSVVRSSMLPTQDRESPLKGILKKSENSLSQNNINFVPEKEAKNRTKRDNRSDEKKPFLTSDKVGHFDFHVHETNSVTTKEKNQLKGHHEPDSTIVVSNMKNKKKKSKRGASNNGITPVGQSVRYRYNSYEEASLGARMESVSGVLHLLVIILCIITISLMAKLTHDWQLYRRRCPLYVKGTTSENVYWGNERMAACNYGAFMPVLPLIMSLTFLLFHGGVLCSWRNGGDTSRILLSKTYPKIMFYLELFELVLLISVAAVITDGFRQTCVGFQLNPWPDNRPQHCKEGYKDRDDAYGLSHTYSRILASIFISWAAVIVLLISVICFLTRSNICQRNRK